MCTQWVAKDPSFLHADIEDSVQIGRMPRLIWVGRAWLVLSWGGSFQVKSCPEVEGGRGWKAEKGRGVVKVCKSISPVKGWSVLICVSSLFKWCPILYTFSITAQLLTAPTFDYKSLGESVRAVGRIASPVPSLHAPYWFLMAINILLF